MPLPLPQLSVFRIAAIKERLPPAIRRPALPLLHFFHYQDLNLNDHLRQTVILPAFFLLTLRFPKAVPVTVFDGLKPLVLFPSSLL